VFVVADCISTAFLCVSVCFGLPSFWKQTLANIASENVISLAWNNVTVTNICVRALFH